jgi:hypothetical protein
MQTHNRQQLEKADKEARREQLRAIQMTVGWDLGFKKVTGDDLYLLVKGPGYSRTGMSSNAPGGKKWIVTKTVQIEGKPVCWCIPVEVKTGKSIDVTFDKSNTFDLRSAYDRAMQAPAGVGDKAPPAPARKPDSGPSAASQFPHAVKFEQGATRFLPGDKIAILEVRGTAATFSPGNIYWIKGTYTLASRDRATLSAYTTAKDSANGTSTPLKAQSTVVTRGSGTFTLFLPMTCRGWAHVSFYPADGGEGFGGNYFGTGDSVLKRWWGAEETDRVK